EEREKIRQKEEKERQRWGFESVEAMKKQKEEEEDEEEDDEDTPRKKKNEEEEEDKDIVSGERLVGRDPKRHLREESDGIMSAVAKRSLDVSISMLI
ncbi:hypothetical protein ADUPG1_013365, partial [Aduncisulcus paluster]